MADMTWDQWLVLVAGVTAIALSQDGRENRRRWAPIFGLLGQPGWLVAAWNAHQPGVLIVAGLYTLAWLRGLWTYWRPAALREARRTL